MTEYRYKVIHDSHYPYIAKIKGKRCRIITKVAGTSATRYRREIPNGHWDAMAKSPDRAVEMWIRDCEDSVSRTKRLLEEAQERLKLAVDVGGVLETKEEK